MGNRWPARCNAGRALDSPLLPILPLLGLRFRWSDLQLAKRLGGGGRGTLDRDGDDRLDPALGKVDATPRAGTRRGDHATSEQQRRGTSGRPGSQGGTRWSHTYASEGG